jgi:hypothetical protein
LKCDVATAVDALLGVSATTVAALPRPVVRPPKKPR